ncbi:cytosolic carboxypeptidase 6 isoform 2, partial [Reticulomyxa filosa]
MIIHYLISNEKLLIFCLFKKTKMSKKILLLYASSWKLEEWSGHILEQMTATVSKNNILLPDLDLRPQSITDKYRNLLCADHSINTDLEKFTVQLPCEEQMEPNTSNNNYSSDNNDSHYSLLTFDCQFESGNGEVSYYGLGEFDLTIRSDTNNQKHKVWYYFRARGGLKGQKITFHVSTYSKQNGLFNDGFAPVVRSKAKPVWVRLPPYCVLSFRCDRHKKYCFNFSFVIEADNEEYFFAYAYPYTLRRKKTHFSYIVTMKFLHEIESLNLSFVKKELLCRSIQQRRVDCLRIEEHSFVKGLKKKKKRKKANLYFNTVDDEDCQLLRPGIVLSARVHP